MYCVSFGWISGDTLWVFVSLRLSGGQNLTAKTQRLKEPPEYPPETNALRQDLAEGNESMNSRIKQALLALALVHVSLVSALTARFLIMFFFERVGTGPRYWEFVHYTLLGYRNSFIPILLIGCGVIYGHDKWIKHIVAWGSYWVSVTSISIFYGLLVFLGVFLSREFTFPRQTWLLAWAFSLAIYTALVLVGRLEEGIRERLVYSRVWHFFIDFAVVAFAF
jgi:hypothetical protein